MPDPTVELMVIDSFTAEPFCGNPAGVVLDAGELTDSQMQKIANEVRMSETAFVISISDSACEVRFFSPKCEVAFCGHASVAALSALVWEGRLTLEDKPLQLKLEVQAGSLQVELRPPSTETKAGVEVVVTQVKPIFSDYGYRMSLLAGTLGLTEYQIPSGWPLGRAYTGLWALVVPVVSNTAIDQARPDFAALADLNDKLGCVSTHLYTFQGKNKLYCRDFSPVVGVYEDPVTGSAMGATAALLIREEAIKPTPPTTIIEAEQGHAMGRPGRMTLEVDSGPDGPERVRMIGTAVLNMRGKILVPEEDPSPQDSPE